MVGGYDGGIQIRRREGGYGTKLAVTAATRKDLMKIWLSNHPLSKSNINYKEGLRFELMVQTISIKKHHYHMGM